MATNIMLTCENSRLIPVDMIGVEALDSFKKGEIVKAVITRPRNVGHHRKFFALMGIIFDAQDRYPTMEHLLDAIKIGVGHYDLVHLTKAHQVIKTRSIAFDKMDQADFEKFWDRVVKLIVSQILPGTKSDELEAQVHELLGDGA